MNAIGSCHAAPGPTLLNDDFDPVSSATPVTVWENDVPDAMSESDLLESLQHAINNGEVDLVSSTYASPSKGVKELNTPSYGRYIFLRPNILWKSPPSCAVIPMTLRATMEPMIECCDIAVSTSISIWILSLQMGKE